MVSLADWRNQLPLDVVQEGKTEEYLRRRAYGEGRLAAAVRAVPRMSPDFKSLSELSKVGIRG